MRSKFYNRNPLTMLRSFFAVVLLLLGSHSFAQKITYSQAFTNGVTPGTQCTAWQSFCSSLVSTNIYTGFTISSSLGGPVYTCTDAFVAGAIASALNTGTNVAMPSDGHAWYVSVGGCTPSACGGLSIELSADQAPCNCSGGASIRPSITNENWGGIGNSCSAPSQTLTVTFYMALHFTGGTTLSVCRNAAATSINSLLTTNDTTTSSTVTWNIASAPAHGTLSGFPASATSGTGVSPSGLTYTPTADYGGTDTFSIAAVDGYGNTDTTTIYVTVVAPSAVFAAPGPICLGNTATFVSGAPLCSGEALNFDGSTSTAIGSIATTATANVTMEAWVKWDGGGSGNQMIALNGNSSTSGYAIYHNAGMVQVVLGGVATFLSSYTLTPGAWTHLAVVADASGNWTLYVNGVPNLLSPSTGTPNVPSGIFSVGTDQAGIETFSGVIDEVKVWNIARTNIDVAADMIACNTAPQAGLAGYWKFDEGTGTTTADASGNGNTLTLTNTTWVPATELLSTYTWDFGDGTTSMLNNVVHTYTAAAVYSTSLIVTNAQGCSGVATENVVVNPNPTPITGVTTVCTGLTTTLNATPAGGTWSSNNTALGSVDAASGVVTGTGAGIPVISYTLITGCFATTNVTVNQTPSLSTPLSSSICDNTVFHYVPASATPGTTYTWSRAAVTGVSQGAASGIDSMNETLTDTTAFQVLVTYIDTLTNTNGCMNIQAVKVTVNPNPMLNSVLSATPVCDSVLFTYLPSSLTPGTSFYWTRDTVAGITNGSNFGPGNVSETLVNSSTAPVTVDYQFILYANSCTDTQIVSVVVNPKPTLTSSLTPPSICDSTLFTYASMSGTANTTYTWSRAAVTGISNATASGMDTVKEILVDTTIAPVQVVYVDTLFANGCMNTQVVTVTVNPKPLLTSTLTPASICDNTLFAYTSSSATAGTTYSWSRAAMTGIANAAASGIDSISEVLSDTSTAPIAVVYVDTLTANGCSNTQNVVVTVNPKPMLTSALAPQICDSTVFNYDPTSATTGSAFAWTRAYVLGIDLTAGSGVNNPFEKIVNNTNDNLTVNYLYTITANGCSNTENVALVSHPTPTLESTLTATVCSGSDFAYAPVGYVFGTTFQWTRAGVTGLTPAVDTGSSVINETLTNSMLTAINTVYYFTLTANGCTHKENVTLTVLPRPDVPQITTYPPSALCSNTMYQNFGTAMMPPAGQVYNWIADNATVYASGEGHQYCLVNFNNPGTAVITLQTNLSGVGCVTNNTYTVTVGSSVSDNPQVIYFNKQLICLVDNEDTYQWGYDDATTLDSTLLVGEIRPNYIIDALDADHRYYWVITTKDGCMQKSYYNVPATAISNVNATPAMNVKVYPNPANSVVNVEINTSAEGSYSAEVLNILGEKMSTAEVKDHKTSFDVKSLPSGCYLIECYRDGVKISASRFIKN